MNPNPNPPPPEILPWMLSAATEYVTDPNDTPTQIFNREGVDGVVAFLAEIISRHCPPDQRDKVIGILRDMVGRLLVSDCKLVTPPTDDACGRHKFAWIFAFEGMADQAREAYIAGLLAEGEKEDIV